MKRNTGAPEHAQTPDYPTLRKQLNDYKSTFYGPHQCEGCGREDIVRRSFYQAPGCWEMTEGKEGPVYIPHHCTHVRHFRALAGKVLTIVDAAFSPNSPQLKAIKDLLKRDFAATIASVRELEADHVAEASASLEDIANDGGLKISA